MVDESNDSLENLNLQKGKAQCIALSKQVIAKKYECLPM